VNVLSRRVDDNPGGNTASGQRIIVIDVCHSLAINGPVECRTGRKCALRRAENHTRSVALSTIGGIEPLRKGFTALNVNNGSVALQTPGCNRNRTGHIDCASSRQNNNYQQRNCYAPEQWNFNRK